MFRSLFGGKKKQGASDSSSADDSIRTAGIGHMVVISGFISPIEDAYFMIEEVNRYDSPAGEWHELIGVDGDRRVGIEWSFDGEYFISVSDHGTPLGLGTLGLDYDALVKLDDENSLDNSITFEDQKYTYKNSFEATFFRDNKGDGDGFYMWEFVRDDHEKMVSVVKWEGSPFEVYTSVVVSPERVTAYKA